MPSKQVKRSSSLAIREIQIKATTCHVTPTRMAMTKRQLLAKTWETWFLRWCGNVKWHSCLGKQSGCSSEVRHPDLAHQNENTRHTRPVQNLHSNTHDSQRSRNNSNVCY